MAPKSDLLKVTPFNEAVRSLWQEQAAHKEDKARHC